MSLLDGKAIRDWCKKTFIKCEDMIKSKEEIESNQEEGKSVDALVIKEVFQSVSSGKTLLASAITDKGIQTDAEDSFAVMAGNIGQIEIGGGSENSPIGSPYLFVVNWQTFSVCSLGSMDLTVPFPINKVKKFVIKRLYFYMNRMSTGNGISANFRICGKKKGSSQIEIIANYSVTVGSTGSPSTSTGANTTELEIDLSEWEEVSYCQFYKYARSGTANYANVTLTFQAELYF